MRLYTEGLISEGAYNRRNKKHFETSYSSVDRNTFLINLWRNAAPARATQGEPTFPTFPYKTLRTVYMYMRNKKFARLEGWPA